MTPVAVSDIFTTLAGFPIRECFFPFQMTSQLDFEKQLAMVSFLIYEHKKGKKL